MLGLWKEAAPKSRFLNSKLPTITFPKPDNYSRFLVIESLDAARLNVSEYVFLATKYLERKIRKKYDAEAQQTGEVLVEVKNQQQATKLLEQTKMVNPDIRVTPYRSLNSFAGCDLQDRSATQNRCRPSQRIERTGHHSHALHHNAQRWQGNTHQTYCTNIPLLVTPRSCKCRLHPLFHSHSAITNVAIAGIHTHSCQNGALKLRTTILARCWYWSMCIALAGCWKRK